tara:strand:- start:507 stop:875 length:369 start_codon:yes stop_codon:yes gene_type:complete
MNVDIVAELKKINGEISGVNKTLTELKKVKSNLETDIIESMQDDGLSLARTDHGTVSLKSTDMASVTDWTAFEEYIYENRALYLLQRRASNPAYVEEVEVQGSIPGVETFTKVTVSLTNKAT